jgi:hypothetical protein
MNENSHKRDRAVRLLTMEIVLRQHPSGLLAKEIA